MQKPGVPFRVKSFLTCLLIMMSMCSHNAASQAQANGYVPSDKDIANAYVYILGRALVVRQETTDQQGKDFAYNSIKYNPLGSADFVNPNFDVAYLEAWIAVDDKTGVLLEVPKVEGRY